MDLDGCEATGDPQLDVYGYQSPRRRGQNLTGFTSTRRRLVLARADEMRAQRQAKREQRRAAVETNKAATRERVEQRRQPDPGPGSPQPAPHIAQAVERGAVGRPAGWYRVDIAPDGSAQWANVDAPGDGPWITARTPAPAPPAPAPPAPAPQWQPVEMTEPSPGTRVW